MTAAGPGTPIERSGSAVSEGLTARLDLLHGPPPVLVLRALGLGDALTGVAALRGLRRAFPDRPLVLATAHPAARLLHAAGVVDAVLPTPGLEGAPPGLGLGPHTAVNLHGRGPQSHRMLLAGRPEEILAFASAQAGTDGPAWRDGEHEVDRWCRLVTMTIGARCGREDLRLPPPPLLAPRSQAHERPANRSEAAGRVVVVHPGAAAVERRWPTRNWAAIAGALRSDGHDVVVTGGPAETDLTADVVRRAGLRVGSDLGGRLGIDDLAALVASARLVLSSDTGVAHLATAYATPSVVLFGPVPPAEWGPAVDLDLHTCIWPGPVIGAIEIRPVLDAALALLDAAASGQDPSRALTSAM